MPLKFVDVGPHKDDLLSIQSINYPYLINCITWYMTYLVQVHKV